MILAASVEDKDKMKHMCYLRVDIVSRNIPLLVSRKALMGMDAVLDIGRGEMCIHRNVHIPLEVSAGGHTTFGVRAGKGGFMREKFHHRIYAVGNGDDSGNSKEWSAMEIKKTHLQLGHASFHKLRTIFDSSSKLATDQNIYEVLKSCTCHRIDERHKIPFVSNHLAMSPGTIITCDICYPIEAAKYTHPCLVVTDCHSRFMAAEFLKSLKSDVIVEYLITRWCQWLGMPDKILCDAGSNFSGKCWDTISDIYGITMINTPIGASYQLGKAERHIQILKKAYDAIDTFMKDSTREMKLCLAVTAHNITPSSGTKIAPVTILTGRTDFCELTRLSSIGSDELNHSSMSTEYWMRWKAIRMAQSQILQFDADNIVQSCLRKNLSRPDEQLLVEGDQVEVWNNKKRKWTGSQRVLVDTGRNVVIENGNILLKHPKPWVRLRSRQIEMSVPDFPTEKAMLEEMGKINITGGITRKKNNTYTRRIPSSGTWTKEDSIGDGQKSNVENNKKADLKEKKDPHRISDIQQRKIIDDFNKWPKEPQALDSKSGWRASFEEQEYDKWSKEPRSSGDRPRWIASHDNAEDNNSDNASKSLSQVEVKDNECFMLEDTTISTIYQSIDSSDIYSFQWQLDEELPAMQWWKDKIHVGLRSPVYKNHFSVMDHNVFSVDTGFDQDLGISGSSVEEEAPIFDCVDLSRIPPRCYLGNSLALDSIRKEIFGLLSRSSTNRDPPLELVLLNSTHARRYPRFHTTLVVRLKGNGIVKSRLCLRGDTMTAKFSNFVSAPTVDRSMIRLLVSTAATYGYRLSMVDITCAFLQSQELSDSDKYIALPPPCIMLNTMPWDGSIATKPQEQLGSRFGLLRHRPLYGSKCAPLRWFLTLADLFRKNNYYQHHLDLCTFSRRCPNTKNLIFVAIVHVDDILACGADKELISFDQLIHSFDADETVFSDTMDSFTFCGVQLDFSQRPSIGISQNQYRSSFSALQTTDFIGAKKIFITKEQILRAGKKFVGSAIWLGLTRFDICFLTTKCATLLPSAVISHDKLKEFLSTAAALYKVVQNKDLTLWYHPFPISDSLTHDLQLIAFSDAGFASLEKHCSMEAGTILVGKAYARNGPVLCHAHILWWMGRKMRRVARSSVGCESASLAMVADVLVWYKSVLHEWWYGEFHYSPFLAEKSAVLTTPFQRSDAPTVNPPDMATLKSKLFTKSPIVHTEFYLDYLSSFVQDYKSIFFVPHSGLEVRALLLTDCINAYQAAQNFSFRMDCKMTKIHLSFIRDLLPFFNLSFVNAGFNVADVGTKQKGNLVIFYTLALENKLTIAFMSRKEFREMSEQKLEDHSK